MRWRKGFTLVEVALTITILGILAVAALPNYMSLTTQAANSGRDGVVGAVRMGISIWRANDVVVNGPPGVYPAPLDALPDNTSCAVATPCFTVVVGTTGIRNGSWTKLSATQYRFFDGQANFTYTYNPVLGSFVSPTAP